jgi:hypothetical protein
MGRKWIHAALAVPSRFLIDLRLGPRTLESATELIASVAMACGGRPPPLLLIDDHLPYPAAILRIFGVIRYRRRKRGRGRRKHPDLKPPPGLQAAAGTHAGSVWSTPRHRASHQATARRSADQHGLYRATQRHLARPANAVGPTHAQWLAVARSAGVVLVVVARSVQLDKPTPLAGRPHTGDGPEPVRPGVERSTLCGQRGACQRPATSTLGRGTGQLVNIRIGGP